ncbi:MAG: hypothetical protein R2704_17540 [Microthrixaceae bacterium]
MRRSPSAAAGRTSSLVLPTLTPQALVAAQVGTADASGARSLRASDVPAGRPDCGTLRGQPCRTFVDVVNPSDDPVEPPPTTVPSTTVPSTTVPSTTGPSATGPSTTPSTAAPSTTTASGSGPQATTGSSSPPPSASPATDGATTTTGPATGSDAGPTPASGGQAGVEANGVVRPLGPRFTG